MLITRYCPHNIEGSVYIGFDHNGEFSLIYVKNYIV